MPARPTRRRSDSNAGPAIIETPAPAPAEPAPAARRGRRLPAVHGGTRVTVDLEKDTHRALRRAAEDMADDLGVHVPAGQLMAALASLVTTDAELRKSVTAYLQKRVDE